MTRYYEDLVWEDDKLMITQDKRQFIIREKPIDDTHPYRKATYILSINPHKVLWEVCDCRKVYSRSSKEAQNIERKVLSGKGA